MKYTFPLLFTALFATLARAEDLPVTLMTKPGKLLASEDFAQQPPPPEGSTALFASGFKGWRCNVVPRGGHWQAVDGTFQGTENPEMHHPATASIGLDFKDVIISCEVRLLDVPLDGRKTRFFAVRTCDTKDYVCSVFLGEAGMRIQKDDNDHGGPDVAVPLGTLAAPIKLGEWQKVTFEILGDEMVGTLNGRSLTGRHPLIGEDKKSIMFVSGVEGSVRHLRVWEALPNPDWAKNKQALPPPPSKPAAK
ncbi:MAG: hypothetical protein WDN28_06205 [Chthoniobacter sp.]